MRSIKRSLLQRGRARLLAIIVAVLAPAFLGLTAPTAHAETAGTLISPSCGDTIMFSGIQYEGSSQLTTFRLVGVDMGQWVGGASGHGTVYIYIADDSPHGGTYNVSGQSGFNVPLVAHGDPRDLIVSATVNKANGTEACHWEGDLN